MRKSANDDPVTFHQVAKYLTFVLAELDLEQAPVGRPLRKIYRASHTGCWHWLAGDRLKSGIILPPPSEQNLDLQLIKKATRRINSATVGW